MDILQKQLLKDESILWKGQPEVGILFSASDIFLVPFSLLWGGFAVFWEFLVLFMKDKTGQRAPVFFALFGIPFVLIGLYFIFGRFFYKKWKKQKTYYAVTDKRVLIVTSLFGEDIQAAYINTLPCINKSMRSNGIGTVKFGNPSFMVDMYKNTGLDFFASFYGRDVPIFYDIKDAEKVYQIVNDLRNK
ncbi:MAG: hypothetical protein QMD94_04575 [Candidatus Omnitrophota bacterium]|nr:hypothetical protein [Candidatus Omnitrophota bacterium]